MPSSGRVFDLGQRKRGEIVEVTLRGNAANVLLVDSTNKRNHEAGRRTSYSGGLVKRSPHRMAIPRSGHWFVLVTLDGMRGRTNASVRVLPGPLPPARTSYRGAALGQIRQAADEYADVIEDAHAPDQKPYDVFICHAHDDKDEVVRPLARALREQNLAVWYDEFELQIGANLRRKIDDGLVRSRFGVVILSHAFFKQGWKQYELDGLVTKEVAGGEQVILPVWHGVSQTDVVGYSPSLAGKVARSTADYSIEQIAAEVAGVARA